MLKYEKMLHFDEHYKKLQESHRIRISWSILSSIMWYTMVYLLLKFAITYVPDVYAWKHAESWFTFERLKFVKIDLIYFFMGLLMICYGSIRLFHITIQNHSVKNKSEDIPKRLLRDGYYASVRHPMYGTFAILYMGMFLSLRSLDGIIVALLLTAGQYVNAIIEEKRILQPVFHEEYQRYIREVKGILLKKTQIITLTVVMFFCIVGFIV
ncbi:MAG: isoprenylcysteine carboxylmethyltransferase family protein [Velocimicrobium sp.]